MNIQTATCNFLPVPGHAARVERGTLPAMLERIAPRQTAEITVYGRVVSVARASDGALEVTFGRWGRNPFNGAPAFEVSAVQPSSRYKSARGAAKACDGWLSGADGFMQAHA